MIVRRSDRVEIARVARAVAATIPAAASLATPKVEIAIPSVAQVRRVLVSEVVGWVAFETGLSVNEIVGRERAARYVRARDAVVWVACNAMHRALAQIGSTLGGRDHTTIFNSRERAAQRIETDPAFRGLIDKLLVRLAEAAK